LIGRGRDLSRRRDRIAITVRATLLERLDLYLLNSLNWKSRARIQSLIRRGKVQVNGELTKPARRVKAGDVVTLDVSPGVAAPADYDHMELDILYEDPWLLAINKPSGLLVHPVGPHVYDTLINYLHHRYHGEEGPGGEPVVPRLCHRIDRDTTGALIVAKESCVHREVQGQFERRLVAKEYVALASGDYPDEVSTLNAPLGEGRSLATCLEHEVLKESRTGVRVLERFRGYALLACTPFTGRQNQIRLHLAAAGHPIVGDVRYGGAAPPPGFPERYLLHSRWIRFRHPRLKCAVEIAVDPPADFRELIATLRTSAPSG
jgi:23S rRNA pseudouridine1911/1915/1917 synthase